MNDSAQNEPAPTSASVARHAGVSRATVSYVLNGLAAGKVSAATQAKVKQAAQDLGYVPHAAARTLRSGSSALVLIAVPADRVPAFGPLFATFVAQFQTALEKHGYTGVLHGARADRSPEDAARAWAELRPAAVLATFGAPLTADSVDILHRSGTRAVLSFGPPPAPGAHGVTMDQEEIGAAAATHLLSSGRRNLGVVIPKEHGLDSFSTPRLAGARAAAEPYADATVTPIPLAYTEESAAQAATFSRDLDLDGVFAYNDEYAMLLMRALQDAGADVPRDTALVGADNLLIARLLRPRLTSVHTQLPAPHEVASLVHRLITDRSISPGIRFRSTARVEGRESSV